MVEHSLCLVFNLQLEAAANRQLLGTRSSHLRSRCVAKHAPLHSIDAHHRDVVARSHLPLGVRAHNNSLNPVVSLSKTVTFDPSLN